MHIRNSAKAVIQKEGHVLLTKNKDAEGIFYLFPGGGQEHGEVLVQTIKRECLEEIGFQVTVGELLHIREYIGKNHEHAHDRDVHQIEFYFVCTIDAQPVEVPVPSNPDSHQIGTEWVAIQNLQEYRIYPKEIRLPVQQFADNKKNAAYLGDIN